VPSVHFEVVMHSDLLSAEARLLVLNMAQGFEGMYPGMNPEKRYT
jgi:hypothetical protein